MALTFDSTHEYHFQRPSMYYCADHETLRICNNFEDSILVSGIEKKDIDEFFKGYKKYVLKEEEATADD